MNPIKIAIAKAKLVKQLNALRREYLILIYKHILNNTHDIHERLFKETINTRKIPKDVNLKLMNATATKIAIKLENSNLGGLALFLLLDRLYHAFAKPILQTANEYENLLKSEYLSSLINTARENGEVFYLCSKHLDSAKDHEPYQGKLYVDNHFDLYSKESIDFIKNGEYDTIQNIINAPVRLVTRNNCRHYFKSLSFEEVKNNSVDNLLTKYKMIKEKGEKQSHTKENAMREKLKFYEMAYVVNNADYIKKKIFLQKKMIDML